MDLKTRFTNAESLHVAFLEPLAETGGGLWDLTPNFRSMRQAAQLCDSVKRPNIRATSKVTFAAHQALNPVG